MPRLESPDEMDWVDLVNQLEPWARESTLAGARALRDRLEALAAEYAPQAAVVDRMKLCRDVHSVLNLDRRRLERAWGELRCLDTEARAAVRASIGVPEADTPLELPREEAAAALRQRIATGRCLLVVGESGVGKSALVVRELSAAQAADPDTNSVVFLNLRHLPPTMTKTRELLGEPLERVLGEMTTPNRLLVIDGADFAAETSSDLLAQLIRAAKVAGVTPWIVAATDASAAVGSLVEEVVPGYDGSTRLVGQGGGSVVWRVECVRRSGRGRGCGSCRRWCSRSLGV